MILQLHIIFLTENVSLMPHFNPLCITFFWLTLAFASLFVEYADLMVFFFVRSLGLVKHTYKNYGVSFVVA